MLGSERTWLDIILQHWAGQKDTGVQGPHHRTVSVRLPVGEGLSSKAVNQAAYNVEGESDVGMVVQSIKYK